MKHPAREGLYFETTGFNKGASSMLEWDMDFCDSKPQSGIFQIGLYSDFPC